MNWSPSSLDIIIGGKEIHMDVLLLIAPLLVTLRGNQGMLPLIAHGRRRSTKW
jgi:hypothetical protein